MHVTMYVNIARLYVLNKNDQPITSGVKLWRLKGGLTDYNYPSIYLSAHS